MRTLILPCYHVPSRHLDPGRPIRLSNYYKGGNPTVSRTTGSFAFNLSLPSDFDTIDEIQSQFSNSFGPRPNSKHPELSSYIVDPAAAYENEPSSKSTLRASAGPFIDVLNESSNVYTPLKSVEGCLRAVLEYYDVWYACFARPFTPLTFEPATGGKS